MNWVARLVLLGALCVALGGHVAAMSDANELYQARRVAMDAVTGFGAPKKAPKKHHRKKLNFFKKKKSSIYF